jgi:hypothetical protein
MQNKQKVDKTNKKTYLESGPEVLELFEAVVESEPEEAELESEPEVGEVAVGAGTEEVRVTPFEKEECHFMRLV